MTERAVEQAIQFLRDRILAAAAATHTALSDAEIKTLAYSELTATPEERDVASEVDAQIGSDAYERKIASLIRAAYRQDVADGRKEEWKAQMRVLRDQDFYVLVMAEQAGAFKGRLPWKSVLSPELILMGVITVAGIAFCVGPLWSALSGTVQIVLFLAWIAALWLIAERNRSRIGRE